MSDPENTQRICQTEPHCECAGEEYSCDCHGRGACDACGAALVLIDCDSGDLVDDPNEYIRGDGLGDQ